MTDSKDLPKLIPPHGGYREQPSSPETAANTMICVIHQTNYLLDRQLRALEKEFLEEGGFTERLYKTRSEARSRRR